MDGALGQEELELNQRLSGISWQASQDIETLCTLGASGTKQQAYEVRGHVNQALKDFRSCLRSLKGLGEEQDTPEATEQLGQLVQEHQQQYERLKAGLQDSYSKMKANAQAEWKNDREALLSGSSDVHRKIQSQQQAVKASQGVTDSLRRTREQMAQQIELTDGNLEILGSSTGGLSKAKDELQSQKEKFATSRGLLSTMETHDIWDRIVLWGGILIFSIVAIYVLQERVLGVTPDFVKSSVSNVATSSFSAIYSLGIGLLKSNKTTEAVPKPFDVFEDLQTNSQEYEPDAPEILEDNQIGTVPDPGVGSCSGDETGGSCTWDSTTTSEDDDIPSSAGHSTDSVREKLEALRKSQDTLEPSLQNNENDIIGSEGDVGGLTDKQNLSGPVLSPEESIEESQEEEDDLGDNLPKVEEDQSPPETQTSRVQEDPVDESPVLDLESSTTIDDRTEGSGGLESGEKEADDVEPKGMEEEIAIAAKKVLGDAISYVSDDDDEYVDTDDALGEDTASQDSMDHAEADSEPASGAVSGLSPMDTAGSDDNNNEGVDVASEDDVAHSSPDLSAEENANDAEDGSIAAGKEDVSIDVEDGSIASGNEDVGIDAEDEDQYEDDDEEDNDEDSLEKFNNFDEDE